jgi:hypothetical protein
MQFLKTFDSYKDALKVRSFLESKGIAVVITGEEARRVVAGAKATIWIPVAKQFNDAKILLENPYHKVSYQVDVDEFNRSLANHRKHLLDSFNLNKLMLYVVSLCISFIVAYGIYRILIKN